MQTMMTEDKVDAVTIVRRRSEHNLSRKLMDPEALKVLYRLIRNGFTAYLVGGGVRDLLLGRTPKDFDVSTDARPRQIRKLFRNSFLIGRRFRLVHVRFGDKVIETSTFRRMPGADEKALEVGPGEVAVDVDDDGDGDGLYHKSDNTFGTAEEDAWRRDFTVNALFYDPTTFAIIDHVGGLSDLDNRLIRCIGEPAIRFQEDPVRMVRAVRFAARLGFTIEPATYEAILGHHEHLTLASAPRLLEEIYRLFPFGSGEAAFRLLFQTGLLRILMPELDAFLAGGTDGNRDLFWKHLAGLDRRDTGSGAAPDAALMFATLYFSRFLETIEEQQADFRVHAEIARSILQPVAERYHMPKRVFYQAIQILDNQRRFEAPGKRFSKSRFAEQATFPATLTLRETHLESLGQDLESLDSWKALRAEIEKAGRSRGDDDGKGDATRRRRPRRGGRRRGPPAAAGGATDG